MFSFLKNSDMFCVRVAVDHMQLAIRRRTGDVTHVKNLHTGFSLDEVKAAGALPLSHL